MTSKKQNIIYKIHLIISVIIVVPVAFIYGFAPDSEFDIHLSTVDEFNFFKAVMGLYIGFSLLWILGIFKAKYLKMALITNMIFMFGLGFGRLISIIINGMPTDAYIYGTIGELILGFCGIWVLTRKKW